VGFVVGKVALGQVSRPVLGFSLVSIIAALRESVSSTDSILSRLSSSILKQNGGQIFHLWSCAVRLSM
jgi:hypothetical protein